MYTRKFRTIVFTKRRIIKCIIYFISGIIASVFIACFEINDTAGSTLKIASGNLYHTILENELPIEKNYEKKDGFDLRNPITILSYYSPIFDNVGKANPTQTPFPMQEQQKQDSAGTESITVAGGMKVSNATNYNVDINELSAMELPFELDNKGPQVLIVHTHTTESYNTVYASSDRTTDETKNIVSVGNVIADILNQNGISTIHDTTVHDYPSYNGAYTRALSTIKENLAQYPSVKIVLDVHRDGIVRDDGTKVKVLTEIDGKPCAQVMIVAGSDSSGLSHDNWKENMKFAARIQTTALNMYPTLMRPLNLREERFNTHMTKGSLILEVGSNGNSLEEAKRGAGYIANVICSVLKK